MPPPGVAHHAARTGLGLMRGGEGGLTRLLRLNGGGGRVTREVFAETMRTIVGRMLAEMPLAKA